MAPMDSFSAAVVKPEVLRIVTICRLIKSKNTDLLIYCLRNILTEGRILAIYGYGPEKTTLEKLIKDLNLSNVVSIISGESCATKMLRDADLFVSLSDVEGFPNSLLEAVSQGVPAMAYDCEFGPRSVLDNGTSGVLIESLGTATVERALLSFICDFDKRQQCSKNGLSHVERSFQPKEVTKKWLDMIQRL